MKRILVFLLLVVVVLVVVMVARALLMRPPATASLPPQHLIAVDPAAVDRFAGALKIATVSRADLTIDAASIAALRQYLQTSFPRVFANLSPEVMPSGALLLTWKGRDAAAAPVILMGHMDVVPADSSTLSHWQHAPFSGDVAEGSVWGRGALDDKSAVLSLLEATETLLGQGFTPARTLLFAFGDDEENGGSQGAANIVRLLQSRGVHPEFVVDEGGAVIHGAVAGLSRAVAVVGISEKGYVDVTLSTTGQGGHSSEPPSHTAIGVLAAGLTRLEAHPFPGSLPRPQEQELLAVAPYLPFSKRLILANLWLTRPLVVAAGLKDARQAGGYHTTTAETMISSGIKPNVLPTEAHATVNLRILPGETIDSVIEGVRSRVADPQVAVTNGSPTWSHNPSPVSPTDSDGYRTLTSTIGQFFPRAVVAPYLVQGGTDSSFYYALTPNVYRFSPIEGDLSMLSMVHGFNEHMTTAKYIHAVQFEAQLIENLR